jgi:TPR repeat protein/class 3 adenylate cyclase
MPFGSKARSPRVKRKIAAILAADIAGYSRLVAEDEEETLRRLDAYRAVFSDFITRFGGRIFNTAGDAILAEFASAVDAVRCAVDVQESLRTRNLAYAPSRQMSFRIGITIGDVVERDGDLLGDGVNIASRLESLAPTGGICISRSVYEAVANKISLKFADLGLQQLKNIPDGVHAYGVALDHGTTSKKRHTSLTPPVLGALAVFIIFALGSAGYFFFRSSPPAASSEPHSEQGNAPPSAAPSNSHVEKSAPSDRADHNTGADASSQELSGPAEDPKPRNKTISVAQPAEEGETCQKYLPMIGAMAEVPCEPTANIEMDDVTAPEHACDRLAGEAIVFHKLILGGTAAVTACRSAVELYPQSRRFKFQLGRALYASGSYKEALELFRPLAEAGYSKAMNGLGALYRSGQGVPKDYGEALKWFRKAAEQGNANAQNNLGLAYLNGQGVPKDDAEAVKWFREAAERGYAVAQTSLGIAYFNGQGVSKDETEAVKWFRKASDQGFGPAQFNLGLAYFDGRGVAKNEAEGVNWYRKAAEQNIKHALTGLGFAYLNGQGVPKNEAEGVNWYRKAAEQGYAPAQFGLGMAYAKGRGIQQDKVQAHKWLNLAAVGDPKSATARDDLAKSMTATQIADAQKLAHGWKPK